MKHHILFCVLLCIISMMLMIVSAEDITNSRDYEFVEVAAYHEAPIQSPCNDGCNNHGLCAQDGSCVCYDGFGGARCDERVCPKACNNHGSCGNDNRCNCRPGWSGYDCSYRGCANDCSGRGACHISPFISECVCFPGYTGNSCELLDTDIFSYADKHAGCKDNCSGHGDCVNSKCYCLNGFTGISCEMKVCKNNCHGRGFCDSNTGKCNCIDTQRYSGDSCEIEKCPNNCSGNGECLSSGICKCKTGYFGLDCSSENCEANCNFPNGRCIAQPHRLLNNSNVIDPADRFTEKRGVCQCNEFYTGASCSEYRCPNNCSGNGSCDLKTFTCTCGNGWSGVACNIKPCSKECVNGACNNGKCVCEPDYTGDSCNIPINCPNFCTNQGSCRAGKCYCAQGYFGVDCSLKTTEAIKGAQLVGADGRVIIPSQKTCTPQCVANQGICVIDGDNEAVCRCKNGFVGKQCERAVTVSKPVAKPTSATSTECNPFCGPNGRCITVDNTPQCVCRIGFYGATCDVQSSTTLPVAPSNTTSTTTNNTTTATGTKPASLLETGSYQKVKHYYDEDGFYALQSDHYEDEMLLQALDQIMNI